MTIIEHARSKLSAARMMLRVARDFKNWREVWDAYRGKRPAPNLEFRSGWLIESSERDAIISLYVEIFVREDYTHSGFYAPQPGDVLVDVGANIGVFALSQLMKCPTLAIHAFEPSEPTRARLRRNLELNHVDDRVTIHPFGLSDERKTLILSDHQFAGSRSAHVQATGEGGESIQCISLREAVASIRAERIALLKMDIEGAEVDAFLEQDEEAWRKIERIAVEFHGSVRPGAYETISKILLHRGYRIVHVFAPSQYGQDGVLQAIRI